MLQGGILRSKYPSSELVGLWNSQQEIHLLKLIWAGFFFLKKKTRFCRFFGNCNIAQSEKFSVSCDVCPFDNCFG